MKKIKFIQNGGGWFTNIGNSFLDLGSMESIKKAVPNSTIHISSVLNRWISYNVNKGFINRFFKKGGDISNVFNIQEYIDADYIVQHGACLSVDWLNVHGSLLESIIKKGIKLIINGGGITEYGYTDEKIEITRKYLKKIKPFIFISRDEVTFNAFKDLAEHSYNGIDCAFWVSDAYKTASLNLQDYVLLNFDKMKEPKDLPVKNNTKIVRTHHSPWLNFALKDYLSMKHQYYNKENTLISEIPYDYLNLYANTSATYSDRVHACVATFSYGKPARLYSRSPRAFLFERVDASNIVGKLVSPDVKKIKELKQKQVLFLSEVILG